MELEFPTEAELATELATHEPDPYSYAAPAVLVRVACGDEGDSD